MLWLIILHTPLWVWPLFLGLIGLGLVQAWDRNLPGPLVLALPLVMVAYSAYGIIATFGLDPRALAAWCAGILATIVLNQSVFGIPHGVVRDPRHWRFLVLGSLLPLAVIMAIFWTRFALGVLAGMSPATIAVPSFVIGVAFWLGLCAGFFPARTIRILGARLA
ncbi:hypothetical protein BH10PSE9_BH10PSE9_04920 [soil metagenome]